MTFKKIRKYLIVLMAVVMVASFAVIPTSAADYGDKGSSVMSDYYYVNWWRQAWAMCNSDDPHWCWASVTDYDGNPYDYYYDSQMGGTVASSVVDSPNYTIGIAAEACGWDGDYGFHTR